MINIKHYIDEANKILGAKKSFPWYKLLNNRKENEKDLRKNLLITMQYNESFGKTEYCDIDIFSKQNQINKLSKSLTKKNLKYEVKNGYTIFSSSFVNSFCDFLKDSVSKKEISLESFKDLVIQELSDATDMDTEQDNAISAQDVLDITTFMPQHADEILSHDFIINNFESEDIAHIAMEIVCSNISIISKKDFEAILQHMTFDYTDDEGDEVYITPADLLSTRLGDQYKSEFLPALVSNKNLGLENIKSAENYMLELSGDEVSDDEDSGVESALVSPVNAPDMLNSKKRPASAEPDEEVEFGHHNQKLRLTNDSGYGSDHSGRDSAEPTVVIGGEDDVMGPEDDIMGGWATYWGDDLQ